MRYRGSGKRLVLSCIAVQEQSASGTDLKRARLAPSPSPLPRGKNARARTAWGLAFCLRHLLHPTKRLRKMKFRRVLFLFGKAAFSVSLCLCGEAFSVSFGSTVDCSQRHTPRSDAWMNERNFSTCGEGATSLRTRSRAAATLSPD